MNNRYVFVFIQFLSSWFKYRGGDSSPLILSALSSVIADIEAMIVESNGQYLSGEKCGAVDLLLWPFFERLKPAAAVRPGMHICTSV